MLCFPFGILSAWLILAGAAVWAQPAAEPAPAPAGSAETTAAPAEPSRTAPEITSGPAAESPPDVDAALYLSRCSGCHTIGEGAMAGPDLAPSTGWPRPDLELAVRRMQRNVGPMTDQEIAALVDLLKSSDVRQRLAGERERFEARFRVQMQPASAQEGERLFFGTGTLAAGGMACSACHQFGGRGGSLGVALDTVSERMGETALVSAIQQSAFKVMRAAYRDHPISLQEAAHLAAFLQRPPSAPAPPPVLGPLAAGAAAGLLLLVVIPLTWRRRGRGVRAALIDRSIRR
jgi:mono/diheme cytochrome c family protein